MEVAKVLAGYSLGDADLLRRAMGKKIKAEMDAQRERFVSGAVERGLSTRRKANEIFDLLAKFADYGFNKSHAAAYALVAFQTAYLKANHPVEFLAASMTLDLDNTDKLARIPPRGAAPRHQRSSRPRSTAPASIFDVLRWDGADPLRARRRQGRRPRRPSRRWSRRGATTPFRGPRATSPGASTRARINKRTLENLVAAGRARRARARPRPRQRRRRRHDEPRPALARGRRRRHGRHVRRRRLGRRAAAHSALRALAGLRAAAEGIRRRRLLPVRPPARRIRRPAARSCGSRPGSISAAP